MLPQQAQNHAAIARSLTIASAIHLQEHAAPVGGVLWGFECCRPTVGTSADGRASQQRQWPDVPAPGGRGQQPQCRQCARNRMPVGFELPFVASYWKTWFSQQHCAAERVWHCVVLWKHVWHGVVRQGMCELRVVTGLGVA